ncbi:MAG: hypothetical protein R3F24_11185 [Gammaproteobacteria bacterium]
MTSARRASWIIGLVLVHFFIVPCASAMMLMPADGDCEHCVTIDTQDACLLGSATIGSTIDGLVFDSGRAELPGISLPALLLPSVDAHQLLTAGRLQSDFQFRFSAIRASGDPPPYLLLGQLRI